MRPATRIAATALAALVLVLAGCTSSTATPPPPEPVHPQWKQLALPVPPGPPGQLLVRDAIRCGQSWYVAGGVSTPAGETRPALWSTADAGAAQGWGLVPVDTLGDYYALRSVLYSLGCRDGRLAAIGAKSGGAHGNPRVRTFYGRPDGSLVAVLSKDFELYGGGRQVSVNRLAGGPAGWLIAGNRAGGATVWTSPDATAFTIHEDVPVLANSAELGTSALDTVAVPAGWVVAGGGRPAGRIDRDPTVWTSADAQTWTRVPLPGTADDEEAQRIVRTPDGLVAVGVAGSGYAAWTGDVSAAGWSGARRFGATGSGAVAIVDAVAVLDAANRLVVATMGADGHRLWTADLVGNGWRPVDSPVRVGPGGSTAAAVAGDGDTILLLADDGSAGTAWVASFPRP